MRVYIIPIGPTLPIAVGDVDAAVLGLGAIRGKRES